MPSKLEQSSFLLFLLIVTGLFGWIMLPFFGAILWAVVVAVLFYPLQQKMAPRFGRRRNLLALSVLLLCTLAVILPALFILLSVFQEGASFYERVQSGEVDLLGFFARIATPPPALQPALDYMGLDVAKLHQLLRDAVAQLSKLVASHSLSLGQNAAQFLVALALMLYLTFFLLRDGNKLVDLLVRALPLGDARERMLLRKISEVTNAAIRGNLVVATVQGTLGGLIFWILGVQAALLWGLVMVVASLLPAVGAALIWVPVAAYFLATGAIWQGVVLIVFGAGVIGLVDNVLRPILVGRETKMPDYLVLFSTLGGIASFGLHGFVLGPLIAALFMAFWGMFIREFNP